MKRLITGGLVAALLATSVGIAEARDRDRGDRGRDRDRWEHSDRDRDYRDGRRGERRADYRRARARDFRAVRAFHRGSRWYWDRPAYRYTYVDNYSYYQLRRPPRGHRWIRANGDFLLVALTTGIILDALTYDRYDDGYYYYGDGRYYDRY